MDHSERGIREPIAEFLERSRQWDPGTKHVVMGRSSPNAGHILIFEHPICAFLVTLFTANLQAEEQSTEAGQSRNEKIDNS